MNSLVLSIFSQQTTQLIVAVTAFPSLTFYGDVPHPELFRVFDQITPDNCADHGFEFETNGRLAHMPGTEARPERMTARKAARSAAPSSCAARKAPTYPVKELGGWIYIFPDENRPGSVERYRDPMVIPEALSPAFRAVEGSVNIRGDVGATVENMLDMLHISFVHSFGNMQEPMPFEVSYEEGYDDPGTEALMTSRVTFRYRSGERSFSKVVGKSTEVNRGCSEWMQQPDGFMSVS